MDTKKLERKNLLSQAIENNKELIEKEIIPELKCILTNINIELAESAKKIKRIQKLAIDDFTNKLDHCIQLIDFKLYPKISELAEKSSEDKVFIIKEIFASKLPQIQAQIKFLINLNKEANEILGQEIVDGYDGHLNNAKGMLENLTANLKGMKVWAEAEVKASQKKSAAA